MKIRIIAFGVMIALFAVSCKKNNQSEKFDYGTFENGVYTNAFFNLALTIPSEWYVFSQEQNSNLIDHSDKMADDNKALRQTAEKSKVTTTILLTASQYGLEVADTLFNPNIMLIAENIHGADNIQSPAGYLLLTRHALEQSPSPKEFPFPAFKVQKIGDCDFSWMRVVNSVSEHANFTQDYYVTLQKEFALTVILTYNSDKQREQLETIFNTFASIE